MAGGIKSIQDAKVILNAGADKVSINSPAIERPELIRELSNEFGSQCVVVGIDSLFKDDDFIVYGKTGNEKTAFNTNLKTSNWIQRVQELGAGEIVLNCMDQDGVRNGYDIAQLKTMLSGCNVPLIASGGAGSVNDFIDVFKQTNVSGALAASIFHKNIINIQHLKQNLRTELINIR